MRRVVSSSRSVLLATVAVSFPACAPAGDPPPADAPIVFPATNRPEVRGVRGAVSAGHPLAAAAGLRVLEEGGNAVDAAITMAGVLAVVRPHMNGVGGDAFGLIFDASTGSVSALNGSGRAGASGTPEFFQGQESVPETGAASVTVPGAVAAWAEALERHGTWPLSRVLEPAIRYAQDGFPVSTRLRQDFSAQGGALDENARALYLPGGAPPPAGSLLRNPALARTLERIAAGGAAGFYRGPVGAALAGFVEAAGGHVTEADMTAHRSEWVDPLRAEHAGYGIHVMPPNTQGFAQLQFLRMADVLGVEDMVPNSPDYLHTLIEVKKLAFADRDRWAADPAQASLPVAELLDPAYLDARSAEVDAAHAAVDVAPGVGEVRTPAADDGGLDDSGDTVYLTAVDAEGNAVSWIQSLFHGFGSGLLEPETGVLLHNRGALFTLEPDHPNQIAPGKRPYHTLTPLLALGADGAVAFTLGTPGGDGQTQTITQILAQVLYFGQTPQAAIEAPRFRSYDGIRVAVEDRIAPPVRRALEARGHAVEVIDGWTAVFGGAQMIWRDLEHGTWVAAADPRREAYALAH